MTRNSPRLGLALLLAVLVAGFLAYFGSEVLPAWIPSGDRAPPRLADYLFYAVAALTVAGAAGVALSRNILWSAIGLLMALLGTGAIYVFLSADFLAVTQLLVLILFAVMLTNRIGDVDVSNRSFGLLGGLALFAAVAPLLLFVAALTPWRSHPAGSLSPTTAAIGDEFLSRWLLPFEVASVVLLATLIGAVVMARKELKPEEP